MKNYVVDMLLEKQGLLPCEVKDHGLKIRVLNIGPYEAMALLEANKDNRPLRKGRVNYYAQIMKQGDWMLTHQGIAFSREGIGLDLQHRLNAIIKAEVTVPMLVVEGLNPKSFHAIDQHERRTVQDAMKKPKKTIEEAKLFIRMSGKENYQHPTLRDIAGVVLSIQSISEMIAETAPTNTAIFSSAAMRCAAIILIMTGVEPVIVIENYRVLVNRNTNAWSPVMHAFYRQVMSKKITTKDDLARYDLFARGLTVLNPKCANLSKVQVWVGSELIERIRNIVNHFIIPTDVIDDDEAINA